MLVISVTALPSSFSSLLSSSFFHLLPWIHSNYHANYQQINNTIMYNICSIKHKPTAQRNKNRNQRNPRQPEHELCARTSINMPTLVFVETESAPIFQATLKSQIVFTVPPSVNLVVRTVFSIIIVVWLIIVRHIMSPLCSFCLVSSRHE